MYGLNEPCKHCFCRSKTVAVDPMATVKKQVHYCCWCGEEKPRAKGGFRYNVQDVIDNARKRGET